MAASGGTTGSWASRALNVAALNENKGCIPHCPVCGAGVSKKLLAQHVNSCVDRLEMAEVRTRAQTGVRTPQKSRSRRPRSDQKYSKVRQFSFEKAVSLHRARASAASRPRRRRGPPRPPRKYLEFDLPPSSALDIAKTRILIDQQVEEEEAAEAAAEAAEAATDRSGVKRACDAKPAVGRQIRSTAGQSVGTDAVANAARVRLLNLVEKRDFKGIEALYAEHHRMSDVNGKVAVALLTGTALHRAAALGSEGICDQLIRHGYSTQVSDEDRRTALHVASGAGASACVSLLLRASAPVWAKDSAGDTPLHYAARAGRCDCAGLLLEARARIGVRNRSGLTAVHIGCERGRVGITALFLSRGTRPEGVSTAVTAIDRQGRTPLHLSTAFPAIVERLLAAKADPVLTDSHGRTPLNVACARGHAGALRLLLEAAPDGAAGGVVGPPPHNTVLLPLLDAAGCEQASAAACARVLLRARANPNGRARRRGMSGETAVHVAARCGGGATLAALLKAGGDPMICDEHRRTTLHAAAAAGRANALSALVSVLPPSRVRHAVGLADAERVTPLDAAMAAGHADCALVLARCGAALHRCHRLRARLTVRRSAIWHKWILERLGSTYSSSESRLYAKAQACPVCGEIFLGARLRGHLPRCLARNERQDADNGEPVAEASLLLTRAVQVEALDRARSPASPAPPDTEFALRRGARTRAHRTILAARSVFFRALFCGPLRATNNRMVCLPRVSDAAFQVVIAWAYGRGLCVSEGRDSGSITTLLLDALAAGSELQMEGLIAEIVCALEESLCASNALRVLAVAKTLGLKELQLAAEGVGRGGSFSPCRRRRRAKHHKPAATTAGSLLPLIDNAALSRQLADLEFEFFVTDQGSGERSAEAVRLPAHACVLVGHLPFLADALRQRRPGGGGKCQIVVQGCSTAIGGFKRLIRLLYGPTQTLRRWSADPVRESCIYYDLLALRLMLAANPTLVRGSSEGAPGTATPCIARAVERALGCHVTPRNAAHALACTFQFDMPWLHLWCWELIVSAGVEDMWPLRLMRCEGGDDAKTPVSFITVSSAKRSSSLSLEEAPSATTDQRVCVTLNLPNARLVTMESPAVGKEGRRKRTDATLAAVLQAYFAHAKRLLPPED